MRSKAPQDVFFGSELAQVKSAGIDIVYTYDPLNRKLDKTIFQKNYKKSKKLSKIRYLYDEKREIGSFGENEKPNQLKVLGRSDKNNYYAVAFELDNEIFAPLYDNNKAISSLISLRKGLVESYRNSIFGESLISNSSGKIKKTSNYSNPWLFLEKKIDEEINLLYFGKKFFNPVKGIFLNPNPISFISSNHKEKLYIHQLEGELDVLTNSENISSCDLKVECLFGGFDLNHLFTTKFLSNKDVEKIVDLKISKEVFEKMKIENISPEQILDTIKRPVNILEDENGFIIIGKKFTVTIDTKNNEITSIK